MWSEPTAALTRSLQALWHEPAPAGPLRAGCYWSAQRERRARVVWHIRKGHPDYAINLAHLWGAG